MIRTLDHSDLQALRDLAVVARNEGFQFLDRLVAAMENETVSLDGTEEFFMCITEHGRIVGVGGITADPYAGEPDVGRIRHVYVHPNARRAGLGRDLLAALEQRAPRTYGTLRLRTDTPAAASFYEALGYRPIVNRHATHFKPTAAIGRFVTHNEEQ